MDSRLMLHEELCKILGSRNVYFNTPESVKMQYPAIRYSLSDLDNRSAGNEVYIQQPSYSVILIDRDPDSPIAKKLSVLRGCRLSRPPYPANGLYHFPFTLKTSKGNVTEVLDEYYNKGCADTEKKYENVAEQIEDAYDEGYEKGKKKGFTDGYETKTLEGGYERLASIINFADFNLFGKKEVVLNLDNARAFNGLTHSATTNTTVEHLTINCPKYPTVFQQMLAYDNLNRDYTFKRLTLNVDSQKSTNWLYFLRNLYALEIVDGTPLDFTGANALTSAFYDLPALKYVRFKGNINKTLSFSSCPVIDVESMKSAILHLTNFAGTDNEFVYTITFPENRWEALEADSVSPNGNSWREYVDSLGWLN